MPSGTDRALSYCVPPWDGSQTLSSCNPFEMLAGQATAFLDCSTVPNESGEWDCRRKFMFSHDKPRDYHVGITWLPSCGHASRDLVMWASRGVTWDCHMISLAACDTQLGPWQAPDPCPHVTSHGQHVTPTWKSRALSRANKWQCQLSPAVPSIIWAWAAVKAFQSATLTLICN